MTVAVLVPLRIEDPWRARAWDYVRPHYETAHAGWPLIIGAPDGELWSRGGAINNAATKTTADRLVIADADTIVDPDTLRSAVELLDKHPWVVPFNHIRRLSKTASEQVYAGAPFTHELELDRQPYRPGTGIVGTTAGGIVAVRRDAFDAVNGHDPRFCGWGGEELAFGWALETLVGRHKRISVDLWHLWHPWKNRQAWLNGGQKLRARYRKAFKQPDVMRALINERR